MKLTAVHVQSYRSLVEPVSMDIGDGLNALVGKNNCGKSNLLTAITLAMDPESPFDKDRDTPQQMAWSVPRIVLDFYVHGSTSSENTLLKYAQHYEVAAGAKESATFASKRSVRFIVEFRNGIRQEYFQAAGAGSRRLATDDDRLQRLIKQFRKTVRFVLVRSGESLDSLLSGRFRDILRLVLRDHLRDSMESAQKARHEYVEELQNKLLAPLQGEVASVVSRVFSEIQQSSLIPAVPKIDQTLADMRIELADGAATDLVEKGAGVRGGVLLALLTYLSTQSRQSVILAVEEPESFLHPGAQEDLRDGLEELAVRKDVTLLVTTHSPFIISRREASQVVALRKDLDGKTNIRDIASGSEHRSTSVSDLFRDPGIGDLLTEAMEVSESGYKAVLVVEGVTDEQYLRVAATMGNDSRFLDQILVVACKGADKVALQAILLRSRVSIPVFAMLDHDEQGRSAAEKLESLGKMKSERKIISLSGYGCNPKLSDVEAEDLWPERLLRNFVTGQGEAVLSEKQRIGQTETFRYGLSAAGKEIIGDWLGDHATLEDCVQWCKVLKELRSRLNRLGVVV